MIFPWEGVTLVGTTDVDHPDGLNEEPSISAQEVAYLMAGLTCQFPSLNLTLDDIIATFAGVRPVIGTGKEDPSQESRDHVVWEESGLLTVTGGKLTTFRLIALDALKTAKHRLPDLPKIDDESPVLNPVDTNLTGVGHLAEQARQRLLGRYGTDAQALINAAHQGELELIPETDYLWAELRWAARSEGIVHLDDLLLRRVRIGLLLKEGGRIFMPRIRQICQPELRWDDEQWQREESAYLKLCFQHYGLPNREEIPDWHAMLIPQPIIEPEVRVMRTHQKTVQRLAVLGLITAVLATITFLIWRKRNKQ